MEDLVDVFRDVTRRSDELGVYVKPPVSNADLQTFSDRVRSEIGFDVPEAFLLLLGLTNGIETQTGWLYDAESFFTQNYRCWCCDVIGKGTDKGFIIESIPLPEPRRPTYAWIGAYGNMNMYIFDFESKEYRSTTLGSVDYVWFASPTLGGLLRYIAEDRG